MKLSNLIFPSLFLIGMIFISAVKAYHPLTDEETSSKDQLVMPLGLPNIPWPENNPYSSEKAQLGRLLYFDKRLSADGKIACATCHQVQRAFTDNLPVSEGIHGRKGTRRAPTIINSAYSSAYFWDGRAKSLEDQSKGPLANTNEMALDPIAKKAHKECEDRIYHIEGYKKLFKQVFGSEKCTMDQIAMAIATFERTVVSGNSPYDKYLKGDKTAMTDEQIHGLALFKKNGCSNCHEDFDFSSRRYMNIGIGMDKPNPDLGRYEVTHDSKDWGAFKVPSLREVSRTFPYMHNGSLRTLEDVVDYYDKGGLPNKNLHPLIKPLHLSVSEKKALVLFLEALNGEGWEHFSPPKTYPD